MSFVEFRLREFVDELSSPSPAPGGGSVAALAGSLGSALTVMVCALTIGKKKYADVENEMRSVSTEAERCKGELLKLVDQDTAAFNKVMAAFGLPKETDAEKTTRLREIENATRDATMVPLEVMKTCLAAIRLSAVTAIKGNVNARSDSGVAALMIAAAVEGAYYNVLINLGTLHDQNFVTETRQTADQLLNDVLVESQNIRETVRTAISG